MSDDAKIVEKWLLDKWGDIINLVSEFQKENGWTNSRINSAFAEVFYKSEKVGW